MSIRNKQDLQKLLDTLSYPPTHTYKLEGLVPTGVLKERMDIINRIAPSFFRGRRFLDIGCNKGFFSLLASRRCDEVVGIDSDKRFIELCKMLKPKNMTVIHSTFRDFAPKDQFDRIFIGNTHHYIFKECRGWQWVYKLAAISAGEVIIEGPIDMKCRDMKNVFSKELKHLFNFEAFMEVMEQFFDQIKIIPATKYTPGRFVMYFKRKYDPFTKNALQLNTLPFIRILKEDKNNIVLQIITKIKPPQGNIVAKVIKHPPRDLKIRISIARYSPISNGAIGSIYDKGRFVGWLEEYNSHATYAYKENEGKLFLKICEHVIFLAKLGYFDGDCATINFFRDDDLYFDKSLVYPISEINEEVYENFRGTGRGYYFIHLANSYSIITPEMEEIIYQALKSKDPLKIEGAFNQIKNLLSTNKNLIKKERIARSFLSHFLKYIIFGVKSCIRRFLHPIVFEDFYPIDDTSALVVCGKSYTQLSDIKLVKYKLNNEKVILKYLKTLQKGTYLRLGNFFKDKFVYSDKDNIYLKIGKEIVKVGEGMQPFMSEVGMLCQRQGIIFLNSRPLIKPWNDYVVVGRPTLSNKWIYFEARRGPAPETWEIWRFEISSVKKQLILRYGANPYVFNGKLFYSRWLRQKHMFETYWIPVPK